MTMQRLFGSCIGLATAVGHLALLAFASTAHGGIALEIGTVTGRPGQRVSFPVTLHADGETLAVQNDIVFEGPGNIAAHQLGQLVRPDCEIGPQFEPGEAGASFHWLDFACTPGEDCRGVRGVVVAAEAPILDGTLLYNCSLDLDPGAAPGRYPLRCSGAGGSTGDGAEVYLTCADGAVVVDEHAPLPTVSPPRRPTRTPVNQGDATMTATPAPTRTLCDRPCGAVRVGEVSGQPGERVLLPVSLEVQGMEVAGVQADISFEPSTIIAARANDRPDCRVSSEPNLGGYSAFAFLEPGCSGDCDGLRALILPVDDVVIPDGTVLFTCHVDIALDAAPGRYRLPIAGTQGTDLEGTALHLSGLDGVVVVRAVEQGERPIVGGPNTSDSSGGCAVHSRTTAAGARWLLAGVLMLGLFCGVRRWRSGRSRCARVYRLPRRHRCDLS